VLKATLTKIMRKLEYLSVIRNCGFLEPNMQGSIIGLKKRRSLGGERG